LSSSAFVAAPSWSGGTAPGSARVATSRSAAAKASARTTDDVELVVAAYRAAVHVPLTDAERSATVRRGFLVHAAGGDPHRDPALDDPAVLSIARDLDSPDRRTSLLAALPPQLRADPDRAWRAFACALLAEAIGDE
jgi:hypothetical protein